MTEIERIKKNVNGEIPKEKYEILRVEDIDNPKEVLDIFKQSIITILENQHLSYEDPKWEQLLPQKIVNIIHQFDDEDFKNDDLLCKVDILVYDVLSKNLKEWQWYSSKLNDRGFEVYCEGILRGGESNFVRFQGIPLSKITIESNNTIYPLKVYKDVMSYKKLK